jgi:ABC-type nitrate/sulfonate/bicarbonate transport system substrate-binding protein
LWKGTIHMSIRYRARRRALAASMAMAAAVLTLVSACSSAGQSSANGTADSSGTAAPSLGTVTMTIDAGDLYNMAEYVGLKLGFFQKYGITPKFLNANSSSVGLQLLATGQLDFRPYDVYAGSADDPHAATSGSKHRRGRDVPAGVSQ